MSAPLLPRDLGGGLVMRVATAADADDSFAVVDAERDRLREWLPWVDRTRSPADARRFFEAAERQDAAGEALHCVVEVDGRFAGVADLRIVPIQRAGEVGYWLASAAVGKGVITRITAELFDIGFDAFGLHRIQLQAATGNIRSRAVAERLGMQYEGVRREAEELPQGFVDLAVYSMLAPEWPGAATALVRARAGSADSPNDLSPR
ncbi:MAG TPA: GNAT family protein [Mycobacteriales bacterium]|nr:GNAT family protein [Mycobacteriales bacterium]